MKPLNYLKGKLRQAFFVAIAAAAFGGARVAQAQAPGEACTQRSDPRSAAVMPGSLTMDERYVRDVNVRCRQFAARIETILADEHLSEAEIKYYMKERYWNIVGDGRDYGTIGLQKPSRWFRVDQMIKIQSHDRDMTRADREVADAKIARAVAHAQERILAEEQDFYNDAERIRIRYNVQEGLVTILNGNSAAVPVTDQQQDAAIRGNCQKVARDAAARNQEVPADSFCGKVLTTPPKTPPKPDGNTP